MDKLNNDKSLMSTWFLIQYELNSLYHLEEDTKTTITILMASNHDGELS